MASLGDIPAPRVCHLTKWSHFNGYGFNLHSEKKREGQFIGSIDPESPAEACGLLQNDRIYEVNGVSITNENHKQVVQRIQENSHSVVLMVLSPEAVEYYEKQSIHIDSNMNNIQYLKTPEANESEDQPEATDGIEAEDSASHAPVPDASSADASSDGALPTAASSADTADTVASSADTADASAAAVSSADTSDTVDTSATTDTADVSAAAVSSADTSDTADTLPADTSAADTLPADASAAALSSADTSDTADTLPAAASFADALPADASAVAVPSADTSATADSSSADTSATAASSADTSSSSLSRSHTSPSPDDEPLTTGTNEESSPPGQSQAQSSEQDCQSSDSADRAKAESAKKELPFKLTMTAAEIQQYIIGKKRKDKRDTHMSFKERVKIVSNM